MAYATVQDVQDRMNRTLSEDEQSICSNLLDDAAVIIDSVNANASAEVKKIVSCRMVIRALGDGESEGVPVGATQGSMSGLGYSQSWTVSNGSVGEIYISKLEKQLLGRGNSIGSYSPVEELEYKEETNEGHDNSISC
ncbi:MAG: hypothetical protein VZR06_00360 [Butyrivibrio sp.]|nr:hypothetical protein [Butyrivibrio sp.]